MTQPRPPFRWRKCLTWIFKPAVGMAIIYILLICFFLADNQLDDRRSSQTNEQLDSDRAAIEHVICLANRVDLLIDLEISNRTLRDLTPEELEMVSTSCWEGR